MFDLVVIGNLGFEQITTPFGQKEVLGGVAHYSTIPAALYSKKIGIVSRVGPDYDFSFLKQLKIDCSGIKVIENEQTARFFVKYGEDLRVREFDLRFNAASRLCADDIPPHYLETKYFHIATNPPEWQKEILAFLRQRTEAVLTVDTLESYLLEQPKRVVEALSMADLIFIDQRESELLGNMLEDKDRVVKKGINGADFITKEGVISIPAAPVEKVVDKTGAGDVLAGIFLISLAEGKNPSFALKEAVRVASLSITDFGVEHLIGKLTRKECETSSSSKKEQENVLW